MTHRLDPLLRPRSIAVVGATERPRTVGRRLLHNLRAGGYEGALYPVNPGREEVLGEQCYPSLDALPESVEHVAFAVSDARLEGALREAIDHGVRAVTLFSQLVLAEDHDPPLKRRIEELVHEAGLLVCGANGMGYYNCRDGIWMCGFDTRENHVRGGNVTLISHSGSGMSGILDCEERIDFNLAVSTGQELSVGMHDYLDFAIDAHAPRVIGLFMETARDPEGLSAALAKANRAGIPVVAIKVGRTPLAARLTVSHSGAVAGDDAAFEALFDRYGVQRVHDMDAFSHALILFAQPHAVGQGGLVSIHDSGGERQLLIDLADRVGTPLAAIGPATTARLESLLDPGLPAVNPLDAWGAGGSEHDRVARECMAALMSDPDAALGAVVHDRAPLSGLYPEYAGYLRAGNAASGKPACLVANRQGTGSDPGVVELTREGFPVLDGLRPFLEAVNCLLGHRDFRARAPAEPPLLPPETLSAAREGLARASAGEAEALDWLRELGLPAVRVEAAATEDQAVATATRLGLPVAMKTARPGLAHKSDRGGVHLDLRDRQAVRAAYRDLAERLGPRVNLAPMVAGPGVEMLLGMIRDPQFGPLVVMGFGGAAVESIRDVVSALPPFDAATARRRLDQLRGRALLHHARGGEPPDLDAYCRAAALFSTIVASLGDALVEIDINPLIVGPSGCIAVDALIVAADPIGNNALARNAT